MFGELPQLDHKDYVFRDPTQAQFELRIHIPAKLDASTAKKADELGNLLAKEVFAQPHAVSPQTGASSQADKVIDIEITADLLQNADSNTTNWAALLSHKIALQIFETLKVGPVKPAASASTTPAEKPLFTVAVGPRGASQLPPFVPIPAQTTDPPLAGSRFFREQIAKELGLSDAFSDKLLKDLAGHVNGDIFLSFTGLEGMQQSLAMFYVKSFLERKLAKLEKAPGAAATACKRLKDIVESLQRGLEVNVKKKRNPSEAEVEATVQKILGQLKSLQPGQAMILAGGWAASLGGHSMYYEIVKETEQTFSMRAYNSGEGIEVHQGKTIHDLNASGDRPQYINKWLPYIQFNGIPAHTIVNQPFWQAAVEIATCDKVVHIVKDVPTEVNTAYGSKDIYNTLFSLLNVAPTDIAAPDKDYIECQHSGTCGWMSLQAMLSSKLPADEFEPLLHELQSDTLRSLFSTMTIEQLAADEQARALLRKSVAEFALHASERYAKKTIPLEELERAASLASQIRKAVDSSEKIAMQAMKKNAPEVAFSPIASPKFSEVPHLATTNFDTTNPPLSTGEPILQWNENWNPDPATIAAELEEFYKSYNASIDKSPKQTALCLRELLMKLPVPKAGADDPFWSKIPAEQRESCMKSVVDLSEMLSGLSIKNPITYEEKEQFRLGIIKGQCIVHKLFAAGDAAKEMLAMKLPINFDKFFEKVFDPQTLQQMKAVIDYFSAYATPPFFPDYTQPFKAVKGAWETPKNEQEYIYQYTLQHPKEFDAIYGELFKTWAENSKIPPGKYAGDDNARATFAMLDFEGDFLPRPYCYVRKQTLLAGGFNRGLGDTKKRAVKESVFGKEIELIVIPNAANGFGNENDFHTDYDLFECANFSEKTIAELSTKEYAIGTAETDWGFSMKDLSQDSIVGLTMREKEEMYSLAQIFTKEGGEIPQELQVVKALNYFSEHIQKFSSHSIRCYFRQLVFSEGRLEKALINSPAVAQQLIQFLQRGYETFTQQDDTLAAAGMIYLTLLLKERLVPLAKTQSHIKLMLETLVKEGLDKAGKNPQECLRALLKSTEDLEAKSQIHRLLLFSHAQEWPSFTDDQIQERLSEIVASSAFYNLRKPQDRLGHVDNAIKRMHLYLIPHLKKAAANSEVMTNIARGTSQTIGLPAADIDWESLRWNDAPFPLCAAYIYGKYVCYLNMVDFTFQIEGQQASFLPASFSTQRDFATAFPNPPKGLVKITGTNIYEFQDDQGLPVRVAHLADGNLWLQRKLEKYGPWYQFVKPEALKGVIDSKILLEEYTHWQCCTSGEQILYSRKTGKAEYQINYGGWGYRCITPSVQPHLRLLPSKDTQPPYDSLKPFELPQYTHVWIDDYDDMPRSIEMPRLSLSFKVEPCQTKKEKVKKERAKCNEITGYWIADQQHIPALGSFKNYLVLQNEEGKLKVIIPRKQIAAHPRGGLTSEIALVDDFPPGDSKLPPYFEYTVSPNGELNGLHEGGSLFLGYLLQGQAHYKEAQTYFREKSRKLKRCTSREFNTLTWSKELYEKTKDNDPKACVVFLTAMSLFLKNADIYGHRETFILMKSLVKDAYIDYLKMRHLIGDLLLKPEEELVLVKYLVGSGITNQIIKDRLSILTEPSEVRVPTSSSKALTLNTVRKLDPEIVKKSFMMFYLGYKPPDVKKRNLMAKFDYDYQGQVDWKSLYQKAKTAKDTERFSLARDFEFKKAFCNLASGRFYDLLLAVAWNPNDFPNLEEVEKTVKSKGDTTHIVNAVIKNYEAYKLFVGASPAVSQKEKASADTKAVAAAGPLPAATAAVKADASAAPKADAAVKADASAAPKADAAVKADASAAPKAAAAVPPAFPLVKKAAPVPPPRPAAFVPSTFPQQAAGGWQLSRPVSEGVLKDLFHTGPGSPLKIQDIPSLKILLDFTSSTLSAQRSATHRISETLRSRLLALANKGLPIEATSEQREKQGMYATAVEAGKIAPFTLENITQELSYGFLRNDREEILKRNPNLTQPDIQKLYQALVEYLENVTAEQALLRQENALSDILTHIHPLPAAHRISTDLVLEELAEKAVKELQTVPAHSLKEHPKEHLPFLIFETSTGFALRQDQVKSLSSLIKADFEIQQMIMGAGKSKILLPILALLKANGDSLPIIIIPAPLYDTTTKDLRKSIGDAFNRPVHTLAFDRNTEFTVASLESKYRYLQEIRSKRECLMVTSKSLQSLSLKFKEALLEFGKTPDDADLRAKVKLMQKILTLIKDKGKAIIDEADWILNAKVEVNFTYGKGANLDPARCALVADLYEQLQSPEVQKLIGGDPIEGYSISKEQYKKEVLPVLVDRMMARQPFNALPDAKLMREYLFDRASAEVEQMVKASPAADELALLKEELNNMLPLTLSKRFCVDYGPSQRAKGGRMLALPYSGNNVSVESSEFRSPDVLMNYTLQTWWRKGIPAEEIERCIKQLQGDAEAEALPFEQTAAYKAFKDLCGPDNDIKFYGFRTADCQRIANRINNGRKSEDSAKPPNPHLFFDYMSKYVLPQITVHQEQLSSNAIDLIDMFHSSVGFTGTPWNVDTFPEVLRKGTKKAPQVEETIIKLLNEKTSKVPDGIRTLQSSEFSAMIAELVRPADDALIDTGSAFNGRGNEEVARQILGRLQTLESAKKGVVFFQKDKLVVLEATDGGTQIVPFQQSSLKPHERFTYYDQPHSIGTDVAQHPLAQATQTIGKDTIFRDMGQGAYRMRGLQKKQSISLVMTQEGDIALKRVLSLPTGNKIDCQKIIDFTKKNEAEQIIAQLQLSTKQKIEHAVKQAVDDYLLEMEITAANRATSAALINEVRSILLTKQSMRPFDNYGTNEIMIPKEKVVGQMVTDFVAKLKAIPETSALFKGQKAAFVSKIEQQIAAALGDTLKLLPKDLSSHAASGKNADGQKEQQKQTMRETLVAGQQSKESDENVFYDRVRWWKDVAVAPDLFALSTYINTKEPPAHSMPVVSLQASYTNGASLAKYAPIVGNDLLVSKNRVRDDKAGLQSSAQQSGQYALFIRNKTDGNMKMMMLDACSDLAYFWTALNKERQNKYDLKGKPREVELCICTLNGQVVQHDSTIDVNDAAHPFVKALKAQGLELRARAKLALGQLAFTPEELPYVKSIIKAAGPQLVDEYYKKHILLQAPEKQALYPESPIARLLAA